MSRCNESFNQALYLYTAVIEFVYFTIIHHQTRSCVLVTDFVKHLKFFKPEVTIFINTFDGKDIAEKCSNMLCITTPVFYLVNKNLILSKNFQHFKQIIYEDFVINKSVNLVLKGICNIQEICQILNLNSIVKVNIDVLETIFKYYPFFYLNKNSVAVVQYHGLLGFHNYTYEKVIQYFLSFIQNIYVMSYKDVRFHSQYVPSCGIRSCLITFCILNASNIFKCRNSQVYISKKSKKLNFSNQYFSMKKITTLKGDLEQPLSINLCLYQSYGSKLKNWTGGIYRLFNNSGLISCVVNLEDKSQKIIFVYFYKTALKFLNEIKNLSEHLNIFDIVQFDAEFHIYEGKEAKYWTATRVSVLKSYRQQRFKFNVDSEMYILSILQSYNLNPVFNYLSQIKCPFDFNVSKNLTEKSNRFVQCKASEKTIKDKESIELGFSNEIRNTNFEIDYFLSSHSTSDPQKHFSFPIHNEKKIPQSSFLPDNSFEKLNFNHVKENKPLNKIIKYKNNSENEHLDEIDLIATDNKITNLMFKQHIFLFGEVETITDDGGIIICSLEEKSFTIYFQSKSLFSWDSAEKSRLISVNNKMLVSIPYFHENDIYQVATFIYLLNEEEIAYLAQEQLSAKDFVFNYFVPKLKLKYCDMKCFCDINCNFNCDLSLKLNSDKTKQIIEKYSYVIVGLKKICIFDEKNLDSLLNFMILAHKNNLMIKMPKTYLYSSSFLSFIFPVISKQFIKQVSKQKIFHRFAIKRKYKLLEFSLTKPVICNLVNSSYSSDKNIPKINEPEFNFSKRCKSQNDLCTTKQCKNILQIKQMQDSCSSLGSYISCESVISSDNVYYSCESDIETENITKYNAPLNLPNFVPVSDSINSVPKQNMQTDQTELFCSKRNEQVLANFAFQTTSNSSEITNFNVKNIPKKSVFKKYRFRDKHLSQIFISYLKPSWIKNNKPIILRHLKTCKYCSTEFIKTTACISMVNNSSVFLNIKDNHSSLLSFPKKLISEKLLSNLKLDSIVKVILIPNTILNFSHVLILEI